MVALPHAHKHKGKQNVQTTIIHILLSCHGPVRFHISFYSKDEGLKQHPTETDGETKS